MTKKKADETPYLVRVPGRDAWHIRHGKKRTSTGEKERGPATQALIEYIDRQKRRDEIEQAQSVATAKLGDILNVWRGERQARNPESWADKWQYIDNRFRAYAGETALSEIDKIWAEDYEEWRYSDGVKGPTVRQELQVILTAWRLGLDARATNLAVPSIELPDPSAVKDLFLTHDEADRLIAAAKNDYMRIFIKLALQTAGRHTALLQLTWSRVDLEAGTVDLRVPVVRMPTRGRRGKPPKKKPRALVRIAGELIEELRAAREKSVSEFVVEFRGRGLKSVKNGFRETAVAAGLDPEDVTPHILRHTAITWLMMSGQPIYSVAKFSGHQSIKMIEQRYGHHHPDYQGDLAQVLAR